MYKLDLIGVGVAFGKIAVVPIAVVKPLPRAGMHSEAFNKAQAWCVPAAAWTNP